MRRASLTITTDVDGNGIGYLVSVGSGVDCGYIRAIRYVKNNYDNGVGVVITGEISGIAILTIANMNATVTKFPRGSASKQVDGTDAEYASGYPVKVLIPIVNERIKVVVSSGGDTKTGLFHIWIG